MNYTREQLLESDATMNQLRNAVYHLARFMVKNKITDLKHRLRRMGRNLAKTYIEYWKPINYVNLTNVKETIATIYKKILKSNVSVEINELEKLIIVNDTNCALCKYHYNDIEIAGCEIILGMVSEYINLINNTNLSKEKTNILIEPERVQESRALGNNSCVQIFKYTELGVL